MSQTFLQEVASRSGVSLGACFHCLSCAAGCPALEIMDFRPNQIIRMIQRGMKNQVLESRTIWICIGCFNCLDQCPNRVDIPCLMDTLRQMALEQGFMVAEPGILAFHKEFLRQVKNRGRIFEVGFMMRYKLATGKLFQDMRPGLQMMLKGRLQLSPSRVRRPQEFQQRLGGSP
ncbi:MAG: 4Fe-4S dicluster domain-containing protein [bacterium]